MKGDSNSLLHVTANKNSTWTS